MKVKILTGLPASGKTTWAREWCSNHKNCVRVNRDDLRNMRGDYWIPKQEDLITKWESDCVFDALSAGYSVILDSTNLNESRNKSREDGIKKIFGDDVSFEYVNFDVPLHECIKRDSERANSVGSSVIKSMYDRYLAPEPVVYEEDISLPHCIIFDIDGTLAKMDGRSPYDWDRVDEDRINIPIVDILHTYSQRFLHKGNGDSIFLFTGRDGSSLNKTIKWLKDNGIEKHYEYHDIFIRPEGNTEKDSVMKKRMFEKNIRGKYYCDMVFDDRDQVVDMWRRELGLTCLQVDYGNF